MNVGDTFRGCLKDEIAHVWVIITSPNHAGEIVMVNFSSYRKDSFELDDTCVEEPGEHPLVTRKTIVRYQSAQVKPILPIEQALKKGLIEQAPPVSPNLLKRIQQGALSSPWTPRKVVTEVCRAVQI